MQTGSGTTSPLFFLLLLQNIDIETKKGKTKNISLNPLFIVYGSISVSLSPVQMGLTGSPSVVLKLINAIRNIFLYFALEKQKFFLLSDFLIPSHQADYL